MFMYYCSFSLSIPPLFDSIYSLFFDRIHARGRKKAFLSFSRTQYTIYSFSYGSLHLHYAAIHYRILLYSHRYVWEKNWIKLIFEICRCYCCCIVVILIIGWIINVFEIRLNHTELDIKQWNNSTIAKQIFVPVRRSLTNNANGIS